MVAGAFVGAATKARFALAVEVLVARGLDGGPALEGQCSSRLLDRECPTKVERTELAAIRRVTSVARRAAPAHTRWLPDWASDNSSGWRTGLDDGSPPGG